jgi:hypothetical protein
VLMALAGAVAAPRRVRRLARSGVGVYVASLLAAGVTTARAEEQRGDAMLVPAVLATMHLAHGAGAYRGAVRHGPPVASIARMFGLRALAGRLSPQPDDVFAPSLG